MTDARENRRRKLVARTAFLLLATAACRTEPQLARRSDPIDPSQPGSEGLLPAHLQVCAPRAHLETLWDNPEWDAAPTDYEEDQLYKLRRYTREDLRRMLPARPLNEISPYGEAEVALVVDSVMQLLDALLALAAATPSEEMTLGQRVRLADFQALHERYAERRDALAGGASVVLPRWYHARQEENFETAMITGVASDEHGYYDGAFVGTTLESRHGDFYLFFGPQAGDQEFYELGACGTRIENTQLQQDIWESFVYLGFDVGFMVRRPVSFGAIPDEADLNDMRAVGSQVPAVREAIDRIVAKHPELGPLWDRLPIETYHRAHIERHLLSVARTCSPQRASELWFGSFQLAELESQVIGASPDASLAASALAATVPGQVVAHSAPFEDSGLFVVVAGPEECSAVRHERDPNRCGVDVPDGGPVVTRQTCAFPMESREPRLFDLESNWLNKDDDGGALAGVTNLYIAPADRRDLYEALANGRFELRSASQPGG